MAKNNTLSLPELPEGFTPPPFSQNLQSPQPISVFSSSFSTPPSTVADSEPASSPCPSGGSEDSSEDDDDEQGPALVDDLLNQRAYKEYHIAQFGQEPASLTDKKCTFKAFLRLVTSKAI